MQNVYCLQEIVDKVLQLSPTATWRILGCSYNVRKQLYHSAVDDMYVHFYPLYFLYVSSVFVHTFY